MKKVLSVLLLLGLLLSVGFAAEKTIQSQKDNNNVSITKNQKIIFQLFCDVKDLTHSILVSPNLAKDDKNILYKIIVKKLELLKQLIDQNKIILPFKNTHSGHNQVSASVKCHLCNGSGFYNGKICPACGGDGYAWTPDQEGHEKECGACDGTGYINGKICPACHGSGWANAMPNPKMPKPLKLMLGQ